MNRTGLIPVLFFSQHHSGATTSGLYSARLLEKNSASASRSSIAEALESQSSFLNKDKTRITDVFAHGERFLIVKGAFDFSLLDDEIRYEYPFFAIRPQNSDAFLIEDFHELLHVLLIDEKYYLATYWQRAESGGRGLIVYALEKELVKVFSDYSDAT